MNMESIDGLDFVQVKAVALAVSDADRAKRFYGETLGLPIDSEHEMEMAFLIGRTVLLLKRQEDWHAKPTEQLNPRITLEVKDAYATEKALHARGVRISDPVAVYGANPIGAFLDSEGNKLWFCSDPEKD